MVNGDTAGFSNNSVAPSRDRDGVGRAHNARPRDGLGRPLPYGARGVQRAPEGVRRTPAETLSEAQRLLDGDLPFHAHEVLEDAWKQAAPAERGLWRGLAQLAVGLTHSMRGNTTGAQALLRRGAENIAPYRERPPHGVDVVGLLAWSTNLVGAVQRGVAQEPLSPAAPRLRSR